MRRHPEGEPNDREHGLRKKLWKLYDQSFQGRSLIYDFNDPYGIAYSGIPYNEQTTERARARLEEMAIILPSELVRKYRSHGLALIRVPLSPVDCVTIDGPIIIDTRPLREPKPKYFGISHMRADSLTVFISSGKQKLPKDYGELDPDKILEGFVLVFNYRVNPNSQIPYNPALFLLYRPNGSREEASY